MLGPAEAGLSILSQERRSSGQLQDLAQNQKVLLLLEARARKMTQPSRLASCQLPVIGQQLCTVGLLVLCRPHPI